MNGKNKDKLEFHIPYLYLVITMTPIMIAALVIPTYAEHDFFIHLNLFIDKHLLGQVGLWSSNFPLASKVIANYISLAGPALGIGFCILARRNVAADPSAYGHITIAKHAIVLMLFCALLFFVIITHYIFSSDLAVRHTRSRLFGSTPVMYAFFACLQLILFYFLSVASYILFFYIPKTLIHRIKEN
jgi:hypothetical protein